MNEQAVTVDTVVGVIGAGTMGGGIARVAAGAGHRVVLVDTARGVLDAAVVELRARLDRDVERRRLDRDEADATLDRISPSTSLSALAGTGFVVEAIVEDLDAKHHVLTDVERIVDDDTIITTNTSSLSIDAIAAPLRRRNRVAGMHFFNPAPVLPLVEVVSGAETDTSVAAAVKATAEAWGKTAVMCASTPGFIVNRVARPFYLESLDMLERGWADPVVSDAAFTGAGFPMGPFTLLDLIGLDVNLAVSHSVFEQLDMDPRLTPSPLQAQMVASGRLGRKSGHGFYPHPAVALPPTPVVSRPFHEVHAVGDLGHLEGLAERIGIGKTPGDAPGRIVIDGHPIVAAPQRPPPGGVGVDIVADWATTSAVAAAGDHVALGMLAGVLEASGVHVVAVADTPGLVVLRTVAMLVAVAHDAAAQGVATADDIDTAMRLGVNHPMGPFEWERLIGSAAIDETLAILGEVDEGRYRPVVR